MKIRRLMLCAALMCAGMLTSCKSAGISEKDGILTLENKLFKYSFNTAGEVVSFYDKSAKTERLDNSVKSLFASVIIEKGAEAKAPSSVKRGNDGIEIDFGTVSFTLLPAVYNDYITFEVTAAQGDFYSMTFAAAALKMDYEAQDPTAVSTLAMTCATSTLEMPGRSSLTGAICYNRTGAAGTKAAIVMAAESGIKDIMKKVLLSIPAGTMPVSTAGGPWASEAKGSNGSYIITTDAPDLSQLEELMPHYKELNIDQIDFHQGGAFRSGDFMFYYYDGIDEFRKISDELHENGFQTGLHTYAQFIDPKSKYITPVPHPDLDALGWFTLTNALSADDSGDIEVTEDTSALSTTTGFFVRNSIYIQIDDEIISFGGVLQNGFAAITRGALGTEAVAHEKGAKVKHLAQFFNLFSPALDSELFLEIARNTAEAYNKGGFDMIYLDAIDGTWSMTDDMEFAWYYCTIFVNEILKYAEKPPLMEYSSFPNNLWYARSRTGAYDTPTTGYKEFIGGHADANDAGAKSKYLSSQLGWITLYPPSIAVDDAYNFKTRYMFSDDIDYLGTKAIANDSGLSYLGATPENLRQWPALRRNTNRLGIYEELRKSGYFNDKIKKTVKERRADFTLEQDAAGNWRFVRMYYEKSKADTGDNNEIKIDSPTGEKAVPFIRVEGQYITAGSYDTADTIIAFDESKDITAQKTEVEFEQKPLPLGLGTWVYGNGKNGYVSIKLYSPSHITHGYCERLIKLDFSGWRYFALVETDNGEIPEAREGRSDCGYDEFRESPDFGAISKVTVTVSGDASGVRMRDVRALQHESARYTKIKISGKNGSITFDGAFSSGEYFEFHEGDKSVKIYDFKGDEMGESAVSGTLALDAGQNDLKVEITTAQNTAGRIRVTSGIRGAEVTE